MIHLHYEMFNISAKAAEAMGLDSTQMVKLKFASNKNIVKLSTLDFNKIKSDYLPLLKQIPAGKRKFDPLDNVWTIPASAFAVLKQIVEINSGSPQAVIRHKDLYADFILASNQNNNSATQKAWHETVREQASFEAEAAEDFFHQQTITTTMPVTDIQAKLRELILPFATFELNTREDFMRGYKIAARRYHPDVKGGDAQKMSELNSLWMQYKEIA